MRVSSFTVLFLWAALLGATAGAQTREQQRAEYERLERHYQQRLAERREQVVQKAAEVSAQMDTHPALRPRADQAVQGAELVAAQSVAVQPPPARKKSPLFVIITLIIIGASVWWAKVATEPE